VRVAGRKQKIRLFQPAAAAIEYSPAHPWADEKPVKSNNREQLTSIANDKHICLKRHCHARACHI
jgi:hypothetical protein